MPLFQKSILRKYIAETPKDDIQSAWMSYSTHFHDPSVQNEILALKEEEYQEGFLRDLFVLVLGYTLKPQPNYNLVLEQKSTTDATKSDGAILSTSGAVIGVIELKDTNTNFLEKIEKQAFGYKHQHKECRYVITSNFQKLRLYIQDAIDFEEFDLFHLEKDSFTLLYCCLNKNAVQSDVPLRMKEQSSEDEEAVTKKLYADYSRFRTQLYGNISSTNPQYNKLVLFKKTQKLLDRFLFMLFAEDRMLLQPNSVRYILEKWEKLRDMDEYVTLYSSFKKFFGYLNKGFVGKDLEVYPYNGGLFADDEILDNIVIDDQLLYESCKGLSNYDFESEVDVNILGHIFEHSLAEIEKIEKQLESDPEGVKDQEAVYKSKRKKDGVFYTPRYITKFMVESTIGALCTKRKNELGIIDELFTFQKRKGSKQELITRLEEYRHWILKLTICDPACGSGAFLNQALEYLIGEHSHIDTLKARIFGSGLVSSDIETSILENNLYGVDINDEAIEIAKLSLWLRTARKGRKLNNLNSHIKSGNSIIGDSFLASDKSFTWQEEFPEVFSNGGFDVIIGNPPYVDIKSLPTDTVKSIFNTYRTANNRINLFSVFVEKGLSILRSGGKFSFIIPSSILTQESYKSLRKHILSNTDIASIIRLPNESFGGSAGEVKVDTIILTVTLGKKEQGKVEVYVYEGFDRITEITEFNADKHLFIDQSSWTDDKDYLFRINTTSGIDDIIEKIENNSQRLIECADFCLGLTPYDKYRGHTPEQITNRVFHASFKKDDTFKKLLAGNDVERYFIEWNGEEWISYGKWLGAARDERFFKVKRILVKQIIDWTAKRIWAAMTEDELYNTQNSFNIIAHDDFHTEYILAILNSKLISFYHRKKYLEEFKDRFQKILIKDCKEFPIKFIPEVNQKSYVLKVIALNQKIEELHRLKKDFLNFLFEKTGADLSRKISEWPTLTFKEFIKQLEKQKVKFPFKEQSEWLQFFESEKAKIIAIKEVINSIDHEIDSMVYSLYGIGEKEIQIIENE